MNRALEIVIGKLQSWGETLVEMLPNMAVALLVLIVAGVIAKVGRSVASRTAERFTVARSLRRLLAGAVAVAILAVGLFVALGVLKLDKTVTSLLAGAGVLGLAIGFAAQNLFANLLSGVMISIRRPIKEGDFVRTVGYHGTVELVDLRVTRLRTPEGQMVLVPNKELLEEPLVNYSTLGKRRVEVEVGVSYSDDLAQAKRLALEAVEPLAHTDLGDVQLFFTEFGASSINFVVRFWVPYERQTEHLEARSEAILRIKEAFDGNDVSIPFPIRTLDLSEAARSLVRGSLGNGDAKGEQAVA